MKADPIEVARGQLAFVSHKGTIDCSGSKCRQANCWACNPEPVAADPDAGYEALSHITELVEAAKKALLALRQQAGSERWGTQAAVATWLGIVADGLDTALQPFTGGER